MYDEDNDDFEFPETGEATPDPLVDVAANGGITITIPRLPVNESDIIAGVCRHFKDKLAPVIEEKLKELAEGAFADALAKSADTLLREIIATPHRKTNSWGESVGEPLPLRDYITSSFEAYMKQRVDRDGRVTTSDRAQTRQQWLVETLGEKLVVEAAKVEVEKVRKSAETQIAGAVANFIATKLAGPAIAPLLPDGVEFK